MNNDVLFGLWPYVALAVSVGGFVVRYGVLRRRMLRAEMDLAQARTVFAGGRAWKASLLVLLVTHLLVLLVPRSILAWNSVPLRLYLLEGTGFVMGGLAVGAWADVMWRHFVKPCASVASAVADAILLALVFVSLGSGLFMQGLYRWGSSWGAATLTPYIASVVQGRPLPDLVEQMPFLVRLHVVSAFGVLATLPFSRAALFVIVGLHRALARVAAPLEDAMEHAAVWFKDRADRWIWPEEDTEPGLPPDMWTPKQSGIVPSPGARMRGRNAGDADALYETVTKAR
jgi:nitrate reductase gamma subunit